MTRSFVLAVCLCSVSVFAPAEDFELELPESERVWIGPDFWANRLHDWQLREGRIECIADRSRLGMRTLSLLTHDVAGERGGTLDIELSCGLVNSDPSRVSDDAAVGVFLGVGPDMDPRSRALIHGATGNGSGYFIGVAADGSLVLRDHQNPRARTVGAPQGALPRGNWQVLHVDSDEGGNSSRFVLDGDPATLWHTEWITNKPKHPHEIVVDLGGDVALDGFAYLPRQGNPAGRIREYELFLSDSKDEWGASIMRGTFANSNELQRGPI